MIIYLCWEWKDIVKGFLIEDDAKNWVKDIIKKLKKNYSVKLLKRKYYYTSVEVK